MKYRVCSALLLILTLLIGCHRKTTIDFVLAYDNSEIQKHRGSYEEIQYNDSVFFLDKKPLVRLGTQDIVSVMIQPPGEKYIVFIALNEKYNKVFENMTREHLKESVAIRVNGKVVSIANFIEPLETARFGLSIGDGTKKHAEDFVRSLGFKPLYISKATNDEAMDLYIKAQSKLYKSQSQEEAGEREALLREAEKYLLHAITIKPRIVKFHHMLADVYFDLKERDKCLDELNKACELAAHGEKIEDIFFYLDTGNIYSSLGKYHLAIEAYKKAIKLNPADANAGLELARLYAGLGEYNSAVKILNKMISHTLEGGTLREDYKRLLEKVKKRQKTERARGSGPKS